MVGLMAVSVLEGDGITAYLHPRGGVLTKLIFEGRNAPFALLRNTRDDAPAGQSAAFPLVPFANRIRSNAFTFGGKTHRFCANTLTDPLALHGDGWLETWRIAERGARSVLLHLRHESSVQSLYRYAAAQRFAIEDGAFVVTLSVTNRGDIPLPFGLGWHPFFTRTPEASLRFSAAKMWSEDDAHLAGSPYPVPSTQDFAAPRHLPNTWINNAYEDWHCNAQIVWPEADVKLTITADAIFRHVQLYVPTIAYDRSYRRDWFCLEPMSHLPGGHGMENLGGLSILKPGETMGGTIRLRPEAIA